MENLCETNIHKKIHRLENPSARAIKCNYNYIDTRGDRLFSELKLSRFTYRRDYSTSVLIFKAIHGLAPSYICNNILFYFEVSGRKLRSFDDMTLYTPKPNKDVFKSSLIYQGAIIWNGLSNDIKNAASLS